MRARNNNRAYDRILGRASAHTKRDACLIKCTSSLFVFAWESRILLSSLSRASIILTFHHHDHHDRHHYQCLQAASKCGGDVQRLATALELTNGGASAEEQQETTRGWALLKECGADFNRILESQLDLNSFMIQVLRVVCSFFSRCVCN